jgi:LTXXQ motif family protein
MRARLIFLIALVAFAAGQPGAAKAQPFPLSIITQPFRAILGHGGHHRRHHRGHLERGQTAAAQPEPSSPAQLGLVGPFAWPRAYEDLLGYTLWPNDYAGSFRGHGFDVIGDTVEGNFDLDALSDGKTASSATNGAAIADVSAAANPCDVGAAAQADWPIARIEQVAQPTKAQQQSLDKLRTAMSTAIKNLKESCRDSTALPPAERLQATVQRLWAVRDAGVFVREPLKGFYDSLTDAQKASFAFEPPRPDPAQAAKEQTGDMGKQVRACASQISADAEGMIQEIRKKVRPNKQQTAALQALQKTTSDMAQLLSAICAQPIDRDPLARLDAANSRLSSLSFAATNVTIALNGFYNGLDDRQKARFNALGH